MSRLVFIAMLCFASLAQSREWTDNTGKHKTEAVLVSFDGKEVTLRKPSGKVVKIPVGRLSKADHQFAFSSTILQRFTAAGVSLRNRSDTETELQYKVRFAKGARALVAGYGGQPVTVRVPIRDVAPLRRGYYTITVIVRGDAPKQRFLRDVVVRLPQKQAEAVGKDTHWLVVTGRSQVIFDAFAGEKLPPKLVPVCWILSGLAPVALYVVPSGVSTEKMPEPKGEK